MYHIPVILAAFVGLCIGSFINVLVLRLDKMKGLMTGRSECPSCRHTLAWFDLIPVLSFILLGGHCRYCHSKISPQYPIVEIATAGLFAFFVWRYGYAVTTTNTFFLLGMVMFWCLFLFDFKYYILPDKIIFPLCVIGVLFYSVFQTDMLINALATGGLLAVAFGILYIVSSGRGMGFGDVKLALAIGLFFGYPIALFVVVAAVWVAALFGILLIILGKATMKTALPFGSFLTAAGIVALLFYNDLVFLRFLFF